MKTKTLFKKFHGNRCSLFIVVKNEISSIFKFLLASNKISLCES